MLGYNIYIIYMKQIFKPFFMRNGKTKGFIKTKSLGWVGLSSCAEEEGAGKGGVWI